MGPRKASAPAKRVAKRKPARTASSADFTIEAYPTKDLFISVLTRDIGLVPAILDLVDNCVDGARRTQPNGNYSSLSVHVSVGGDEFRIADNCGGIPLAVARDYAFRFGRPVGFVPDQHSIGQFGVGMKRALFKLGRAFTIESRTMTETWRLPVDVEKWRDAKKWEFKLEAINRTRRAARATGTTITVTTLHDNVKDELKRDHVQATLKEEIRRKHQDALERGLEITLNETPVQSSPLDLLVLDDELYPAVEEFALFEDDPPVVNVRLFAGLGPQGNTPDAGWCIYCNGRLVLGPDQSSTTGWGGDLGKRVPLFHGQYARFRGFAFFDCDHASRLPWTTTKIGVDENSVVYRYVKERMIVLMRPVIDFLNAIDRERDMKPKDDLKRELLEAKLSRATPMRLDKLSRSAFFAPKSTLPKPPKGKFINILFQRPRTKVEQVKSALGVESAAKAGEGAFDYFYERECED